MGLICTLHRSVRSLITSGWVYIEKHIFIFIYKWGGVGAVFVSASLQINRMCGGVVLYVWVVVTMET